MGYTNTPANTKKDPSGATSQGQGRGQNQIPSRSPSTLATHDNPNNLHANRNHHDRPIRAN